MRRGLLICCVGAVACLPVAASDAATVKSTFDSSVEGWTVAGDPSAQPTFVATGGNPGGFSRVADTVSGATMYWAAPPRFRGDRSGDYGGELSFDLKQSSVTSQFDDDDVVLSGGGLTLVFNTPQNPGIDWTHYAVSLTETAGWKNKATGSAPTKAQMVAVLASLTSIRIRAEYVTGPDTDDLDNVVFGDAQPIAGKTVVVRVVSGRVLISTPAGAAAYGPIGRVGSAAAKKFRRFKGSASIPVGSTLDTRAGKIEMTSAADLKGNTQRAQFYAGIFTVRQKRTARPSTDLALESSSFAKACGAVASRATAAKGKSRRVLGRLFGRGKGRYKTTANFSAASVRGTTWLTEDRCDGTLTKVTSGKVAVRDLAKNKTVTVTAGHSYLARATRAAIKRLKVR